MPEIVKYVQSEEMIFVVGFGNINYDHVKKTVEKVIEYINEYPVKMVMSNHLNVESVPQEVDVFNLGAMIGQIFKELKIAIIYPTRFKEFYSLFVQAANSRGGNIKLFEQKQDAFQWICNLNKKEVAR